MEPSQGSAAATGQSRLCTLLCADTMPVQGDSVAARRLAALRLCRRPAVCGLAARQPCPPLGVRVWRAHAALVVRQHLAGAGQGLCNGRHCGARRADLSRVCIRAGSLCVHCRVIDTRRLLLQTRTPARGTWRGKTRPATSAGPRPWQSVRTLPQTCRCWHLVLAACLVLLYASRRTRLKLWLCRR